MENKTLNIDNLILRNDTAANWASKNPTLLEGELGVEIDTRKFKIGDGTTPYNDLRYASGGMVEIKTVAPATTDTDYEVGTLWLDTTKSRAYVLFAKNTTATWLEIYTQNSTVGKATEATSATKLKTARNITLLGAVVSVTKAFDGSEDVEFNLVLSPSGVKAGTYTKLTVNAEGIITGATTLAASDIPSLTLAKISDAGTAASKNVGTAAGNVPVLDDEAKILVSLIPSLTLAKISDAGTAAAKDVGTSAGNVPLLGADGKLDTAVLPAIAISDTFTVASESEMLKLTAQRGDIAIRTDVSKSFILAADGASTLANWKELKTPDCKVLSVNGKTGAITLTTDDVAEGAKNLYFTDARATANFNTNITKASVKSLKDGTDVLLSTDTYTLNCGKA